MKDLFGHEIGAASAGKAKDREQARQRMEKWRGTASYQQWLIASREQRRQFKEKYRRQSGVLSLHEKAIKRDEKRKKEEAAKQASKKHDAHVREWRRDESRLSRWKYENDPTYAMYHRMKRWMNKHLTEVRPSKKWADLLGYTAAQLRDHIERQFLPGMTWGNKGQWHIDHIIPVSSFNIASADSPEFRVCFGLPNLRPLWAQDNLAKSDKVETLC